MAIPGEHKSPVLCTHLCPFPAHLPQLVLHAFVNVRCRGVVVLVHGLAQGREDRAGQETGRRRCCAGTHHCQRGFRQPQRPNPSYLLACSTALGFKLVAAVSRYIISGRRERMSKSPRRRSARHAAAVGAAGAPVPRSRSWPPCCASGSPRSGEPDCWGPPMAGRSWRGAGDGDSGRAGAHWGRLQPRPRLVCLGRERETGCAPRHAEQPRDAQPLEQGERDAAGGGSPCVLPRDGCLVRSFLMRGPPSSSPPAWTAHACSVAS